ncbi:HNH endonuclease [Candidatus Uhrbacteria bacterium]|nr:HNH endonuclease [Candidatus Uhrbacteria bacterium]
MLVHQRHPNTVCRICNKSIYRRPVELHKNQGNAFCSARCYGISCRKEKPCTICGTPILAGANKKTCSRRCANKQRTGLLYKLNRPKDKVIYQKGLKMRLMDERGKKCQRCGYDNEKILNVHHINRDRKHNDLKNLELICPNCHAEEHYGK